MQKGSLWMHTAKRRMMLGSFKRDMIFISLRKSFLPMENNLQVKGEKNKNFTCTLAISFHLKGTRSTGTPGIFIGIWTEHLHSHQDGLIFCDVKQKLFIHKLLHSFCLTQVDLEEKQGAGRVRFKTWLVFYLMQTVTKAVTCTSPNWPSPSFSLNVSSFRGNSSTATSFPDNRSIVTAGMA